MGYYLGASGAISPKDYARQNFRGVWAASLTPFKLQNPFVGAPTRATPSIPQTDFGRENPFVGAPTRATPSIPQTDFGRENPLVGAADNASIYSIYGTGGVDWAGWQKNLRHWINDLYIDGLFIGGKQAEAASLSLAERKELFATAVTVAAASDRACGIITSCSDANLATVIELAEYSQAIGADYVVIHSPVLHFHQDINETIYEYYRYLSERLEIGIALWNHPDCGYVMSPKLCARIAELPNIVAIKYSVERALYAELTSLAGDKILVSTSSEAEWLENIIELKWQLYLCSTPPILLQTQFDRRIHDYTNLAFAGLYDQARLIRDSLNPAREAFRASRPTGTPQAHSKYWQEKLGQVGGLVRRPLLNLTQAERIIIDHEFARSGIRVA